MPFVFRSFAKGTLAFWFLASPCIYAAACIPSASLNAITSPVTRANGETELVGEIDISNIGLTGCAFSGSQVASFTLTFPVAVTNPVESDGVTTDAVLVNTSTGDSYKATLSGPDGLQFTLPATSPAGVSEWSNGQLTGTLQLLGIRLDAAQQGFGQLAIRTYSGGIFDGYVGYAFVFASNPQLNVAFLEPAETYSVAPASLSQCNPSPAPGTTTPSTFTVNFTTSDLNQNAFLSLADEMGPVSDATQGTRLFATFTNIPAGATLYASATNVGTNDAYKGVFVTEDPTAPGNGKPPKTPKNWTALTPGSDGSVTAVWEITDDTGKGLAKSVSFGIYVEYSHSVAPTSLANPVTMSGGLAPYDVPDPLKSLLMGTPIPRFAADTNPALGTVFTIAACPCSYSLSASEDDFSFAGGKGSLKLTASSSSCSWTIDGVPSWIRLKPEDASFEGTRTIRYHVRPDAGAPRSASLTIAGQVYTVKQSGRP